MTDLYNTPEYSTTPTDSVDSKTVEEKAENMPRYQQVALQISASAPAHAPAEDVEKEEPSQEKLDLLGKADDLGKLAEEAGEAGDEDSVRVLYYERIRLLEEASAMK